MSRLNLIVNFLNTMKSNNVQEAFTSLTVLLDELESKNNPDPIEINLVDSIYHLIEKLNLLESLMSEYKRKQNEDISGNKLVDLYESNDGDKFIKTI